MRALFIQCEHAVLNMCPSECPLCEEWEISLRGLNVGVENLVVTLDQFEKHLGKHLETLALFVLPRLPGEDDVNNTISRMEDSRTEEASQNSLASDEPINKYYNTPQTPLKTSKHKLPTNNTSNRISTIYHIEQFIILFNP